MDAKELRAQAALTERSNDGSVKFAVQYDKSKCEPGSGARPCAVIGPDRVVLPARDAAKKPAEPWLASDPGYRRLPDYPYKMSDHKDPSRNISPRQTFQENMQRIIMPPGYNATKLHEDPTFASRNNKLNLEVKYCDVPYNINQVSSDQKHILNGDHSALNVNPLLMRGVPHGWPAGSVHVRPLRTYGGPEGLQYPDYANCTGPRPVLTRTHTAAHDEQLYPDAYYHESNIRFKPYPNLKERYPPTRYEYLGNYPNPYHQPNPFAHKYELPKTIPPTYSGYPQVPKYTERIPDPIMDGYQRTYSQQGNYGVPIRNPVIHSPYRPVPGNHMQNKLHPYPPDGQHKPVPNKLPYDPASKMYLDYDNRGKPMPMADNYYVNELHRSYHPKNTIVLPNFTPANMHGANGHPCYPLKNYDCTRYKNIDPSMMNHSLTKLPPQFSPSTLAISPADSNASNETAQTHGTTQEDCGYASQSSVTSARSIESLNRMPMDIYGRYDYRYSPVVRSSPSTKPGPSSKQGSKTKKDIRQFISSWSEGDDENAENSAKRDGVKTIPEEKNSFNKQYETVHNQEQLYVLGLVNVPSEELSKYEHIQKVSKLPENIKGYNSLELLNQFEEAIESSNISSVKPPTPRAAQIPIKRMLYRHDPVPRALSPLDVEAKISQSVIHKDVGCNFEIKPCSPKMLNVEVATSMQTLLNERVIEKVSNPHNVKSPIILQSGDENIENSLIAKTIKCPVPNTTSSCKMINSQNLSESSGIDHSKTNYSLQDLESNSGVCLASLPRLDNDIELNFPEVNQQFINANKTDSVITTSFAKNLSALDVERSATANPEYDMNYQFSPKMETESDFSRLSKYRKLKRCIPDDNDSALAKAQATRVDSVIIKNPDNTRSIEESTDNTNPGGHFRNDFQEYAMNLVSQAKNSKENHHHDVDKLFGTSTSPAVTSRYDDINTHSPNNITSNQSSNLLNKNFDVIEDTSGNNTGHAQSEHSVHSKDLSNRYLEKAALEIPMNLSPQARYSTIGVDEEIRNSTSGDKTPTFDGKRQYAEVVASHKKNEEEEPKYSNDLNLDKIEDTLIKSRAENGMDTSDNHCLTRDEPLSSVLEKRDDVGVCNDDHLNFHGDHLFNVNDMCSNEEGHAAFEIKQIDIESKATGEVNRGHDIFDDKELKRESEPTAVGSDVINEVDDLHKQHDTLKKYDRYVSKLKRKKHRAGATHRKRSIEKKSANIADGSDLTEQNLTILFKIDEENPIKHSNQKEPHIIPDKDVPENNVKSDTNLINKDIENVKNRCNLGDVTIQFTPVQTTHTTKKHRNENNDTAQNISQNCPDVIKDNISFLGWPTNDKWFKISSEKEMNETALNNIPVDFDSDAIEHRENLKLRIETNLIGDSQLVSSKRRNNDALVRTMSVDESELEKVSSLKANESVNFEGKERDAPIFSDQRGTQSKQIVAELEKTDLNTQVLPDKQIKKSKTDDIRASDQYEEINKEFEPPVSISFKTKDLEHCEHLKLGMETNLICDAQLVSSKSRNNDALVKTMSADESELEKVSSLKANESVNFEGKELDALIFSDQRGTQRKQIVTELEKTDLNTQVLPGKQIKESKTDDIRASDQNEEINKEFEPPVSISFKTKDLEHSEHLKLGMETNLICDAQLVSRKSCNNDALAKTLPVDKTELEKVSSLKETESVNFEGKELDASIFSDQLGTQSKQIVAKLEKTDLNTQVLHDINDKQIKENKTDDIRASDQNEEINREFEPPIRTSFKTKDLEHCENLKLGMETNLMFDAQLVSRKNSNNDALARTLPVDQTEQEKAIASDNFEKELDTPIFSDRHRTGSQQNMQIREHLKIIPSKNEDFYQDVPIINTEGNPSDARSEYEIRTDFSQAITYRRNGTKVYRSYVSKELFSPRFQNLLICNENIDVFSGAREPKIAHEQLNLERKIFASEENEMGSVKSFTKISNGENIIDLDTSHSSEPNILHNAGTNVEYFKVKPDNETEATTADEEYSKERLDMERDATTVETNTLSSDCDLNNDFDDNKKENPSSELQLKCTDATQIITAADSFKKSLGNSATKSYREEVFDECDKNLDNCDGEGESNFRLNENNVESDVSATNVIVIGETISVSPEHCHEFSAIDTSADNIHEYNKKLQTFLESVTAKPRFALKRSLSDSALNSYENEIGECSEKKRKKHTEIGKIEESHLLNFFQNSRRNSISTLNNENFSFCILIDDHCIVAEENYDQDDFAEMEVDLLNPPLKDPAVEDEKTTSPVYNLVDQNVKGQDTYMAKYDEEKAWVEDVGCEETIETEDIAENIVIGNPASPKDDDLSDYDSDDEEMDNLNNEVVDHTSKVKHIYGDNMCTNDAQLVDALYRTPQMDVNKKLMDRESHITEKSNKYYDSDSLEMLLAEPVFNIRRPPPKSNIDNFNFPTTQGSTSNTINTENKDSTCIEVFSSVVSNILTNVDVANEKNIDAVKSRADTIAYDKTQDETIHSCESSLDNVFSYIHKGNGSQTTSSSPEVSSTTSEEKNSSILLKISSFKGSRISEVKSLTSDVQKENNCKLGPKEYFNPNYNDGMALNRPLRTKAAQKYIPPLRESIPDLKVKLALPQQSLLKFQKIKIAKEEPKLCTRNIYSSNNINVKLKNEIPRKIKPKFEDVLKNIDEAQFQMHKEKNRKAKKYIPKVVIKKSENGSHYASTSAQESFNPDLTGRRWQPWVFIEKDKFIDGMALKNKSRAVYSHRRKSFVLAEHFSKYKSIGSAKFVISQPKINDYSTGKLKYTIKLKHSY